MNNQFYNIVLEVLKQDKRFFTDNGELLRNSVYEAAMQMDSKLIKLLLSNEETKKRFFNDDDGIIIFDTIEFGWVINNRILDSYTRYKDKIGLVIVRQYIYIKDVNSFSIKTAFLSVKQRRSAWVFWRNTFTMKWTGSFILRC